MSYLNITFQQCAGYGWQGGPTFNTQVVPMTSGRERRNAQIDQPQYQFQAPYQNIKRDAYSSIKDLFAVCRGRLHCFKFRDELDYIANNWQFGTGDGSTTVFQLGKVVAVGPVSYKTDIYVVDDLDPEAPAPVFTVNGAPAAGTVDADRGTVTLSVAPANGAVLRWSGWFMHWVRFNQDYLPFSIDNGNGQGEHYINGSVDLLSMKPPPL